MFFLTLKLEFVSGIPIECHFGSGSCLSGHFIIASIPLHPCSFSSLYFCIYFKQSSLCTCYLFKMLRNSPRKIKIHTRRVTAPYSLTPSMLDFLLLHIKLSLPFQTSATVQRNILDVFSRCFMCQGIRSVSIPMIKI